MGIKSADSAVISCGVITDICSEDNAVISDSTGLGSREGAGSSFCESSFSAANTSARWDTNIWNIEFTDLIEL